MAFTPFEMERYQSTWEHDVEFNLSESSVYPMRLGELCALAGMDREELASVELEYVQSNGGPELRDHIAGMYEGADREHVLVTSGSAEANFLAAWELLGPDDEVVFMEPNYFQIHGLAANFGAAVREWWLRREPDAWEPDPDRLESLITPKTKAIVVTSPHNPTGACFPEDVIARIAEIAERRGIWLVADEVYRGAEISGDEWPSFWGRADRLIVTGGLSKAYGAPGLRIGWAVTSPEMATRLWARSDYTTISTSAVSQALATAALAPDKRGLLLGRTRQILRANWPILEQWLQRRSDAFDWVAPQAGAIAFVRFRMPIDSLALAERMRTEVGCLLVPGAHFRTPEYLRIGFGPPEQRLLAGLDRMARVVDTLRRAAS